MEWSLLELNTIVRYKIAMNQAKLKFDVSPKPNGTLPIKAGAPDPIYWTKMGALFEGDCLDILPFVRDETVDTVFADPPFNLGKTYGSKVDDSLDEAEYVAWCEKWVDECVRVLQPGG